MRTTEMIGLRFGRLTVVAKAESVPMASGLGTRARVLARCDCGVERVFYSTNVVRGRSRACGCHRINKIHGESYKKTSEYRTWENIKCRCLYESTPGFEYYGGRGIRVCDRWLNGEGGKTGYECFLADMGRKPPDKTSIDRYPNNDGHYEPGNCRWADWLEQAANKRPKKRAA